MECMIPLERRHRRSKLLNTVTIDSIHEKNFLSSNSILEAIIVDTFILPGTVLVLFVFIIAIKYLNVLMFSCTGAWHYQFDLYVQHFFFL